MRKGKDIPGSGKPTCKTKELRKGLFGEQGKMSRAEPQTEAGRERGGDGVGALTANLMHMRYT